LPERWPWGARQTSSNGCRGSWRRQRSSRGSLAPGPCALPRHVVYRFADADKQRAWEESAERAAWLARADEFARQTGTTHVSGLETWFALPGRTAPAPPKWKMAVVTFRRDLPSGAAGQPGAGAADGGLALAVSASCLRRGPCAADDLDCHAAAHPTAAPLALPSIVRVCGSRDGRRGPDRCGPGRRPARSAGLA